MGEELVQGVWDWECVRGEEQGRIMAVNQLIEGGNEWRVRGWEECEERNRRRLRRNKKTKSRRRRKEERYAKGSKLRPRRGFCCTSHLRGAMQSVINYSIRGTPTNYHQSFVLKFTTTERPELIRRYEIHASLLFI